MKQPYNRQININLIVLGIVFAITFVSLFTYFPIYANTLEQKTQEMKEDTEIQAILLKQILSPVTNAKTRYAKDKETKRALKEIKTLWLELEYKNPNQEFFLVSKNPNTNKLELLLSSKGRPPQSGHVRLIKPTMYMALSGQNGVQSITDIADNTVLASYAPIIDNEWGVVIMFEQSAIKPFLIENLAYTVFSALLITLIIWLVLRITLRNLNSRVTASEKRYHQLLETTPDWVWETDNKGNITYSSHQVFNLLGYKPEEVLSHPISALFANIDTKTSHLVWQQKLMLSEPFHDLQMDFKSANHQRINLQLSAQPIYNKRNKMLGYRGIARDITSLKQREDKIINMAYFDTLTLLANRKLFVDKLHQRLQSNIVNEQKPNAVILIDLDNFKKINETQGHSTGDKLIKIVAQRIQAQMLETNILSRFGGDEFAILTKETKETIPSEHHNQITAYVTRILESINVPIILEDNTIHLSASVGIAIIPKDANSVADILKCADNALLQAKKGGKNRFQFYSQENQNKADERIKNAKQLTQALAENQFEIYYQCQYNTLNNKIIGMEALLRWHHPDTHKILPAFEFLKNAYEYNNILKIDEWVIKTVASDISRFSKIGMVVPPISINLSSQKLEEVNLPKMFEETIKRHFISASSIKVEITESSLLHDLNKSMRTLQQLRNLGIKVCIDNFGTGYSSLSYIQSLPIESIKIDKSFIENIATSKSDIQICRTFIQLAKSLQLSVIAEGIQSEVQSEILKNEGCHIQQGYLYSRPEPIDKIMAELNQNLLST